MSKHRNFGQAGRSAFGTSHGAGKGSVERSTEWREKYEDVNWPEGGKQQGSETNGFVKRGGKLVKKYGAEREPEKFDKGPNIKV